MLQDNSYSKITSKILKYYLKVVKRRDLDSVKATLGEMVKQRHVFDVRRAALRAALEKICEKMIISGVDDGVEEASLHSMSLLSAIGSGGGMNAGQARGGSSLLSDLQQEIHRLQDDDRSMRMELTSIQFMLNQRNEELESMREENEKDQLAIEAFGAEKAEMQISLEEAKTSFDYERSRRIAMEQQLESFKRDNFLEYSDEIARLQRDFAAMIEEKAALDAKCNQLKIEKKQLKAAAIKFKADLDLAEKKIEQLFDIQKKLGEENQELKGIVSSSEKTYARKDNHSEGSTIDQKCDEENTETALSNIKMQSEDISLYQVPSVDIRRSNNTAQSVAEIGSTKGQSGQRPPRRKRIMLDISFGF